MTRRERGTGSIFERSDGTFTGCISLPNGPDGKRRRRYVYGATKSDVKAALKQAQAEVESGVLRTSRSRLTVKTFLEDWVAGKEASPRTIEQYRKIIERHLAPRLATVLLAEFDELAVEEFLRDLKEANPGDRTRQYCFDVLRVALNRAVALKLIPRNPMTGAERPYIPRRQMSVWMHDEAARVLEAARADRFHALYVMQLRLGLQFPGEVLGLRWDRDVDMRERVIRVGGQFARGRYGATKTQARRRQLNMPEEVYLALCAHRERLFAEGLRGSPFVFPNGDGGAQNPRNFVRDSFEKVVTRAGVPRLRPYDMRHTFATLALTAGVNIKVVSRILGHANEVETLRTYVHFVPSQLEDANALIDAYWARMAGEKSKG